MSYSIELDRERPLKYGMRAIDFIEKKLGVPFMKIEGISEGSISMNDFAVILLGGLIHDDKNLTKDKLMDLVDEYSSFAEVANVMWKAINEALGVEDEGGDTGGKK